MLNDSRGIEQWDTVDAPDLIGFLFGGLLSHRLLKPGSNSLNSRVELRVVCKGTARDDFILVLGISEQYSQLVQSYFAELLPRTGTLVAIVADPNTFVIERPQCWSLKAVGSEHFPDKFRRNHRVPATNRPEKWNDECEGQQRQQESKPGIAEVPNQPDQREDDDNERGPQPRTAADLAVDRAEYRCEFIQVMGCLKLDGIRVVGNFVGLERRFSDQVGRGRVLASRDCRMCNGRGVHFAHSRQKLFSIVRVPEGRHWHSEQCSANARRLSEEDDKLRNGFDTAHVTPRIPRRYAIFREREARFVEFRLAQSLSAVFNETPFLLLDRAEVRPPLQPRHDQKQKSQYGDAECKEIEIDWQTFERQEQRSSDEHNHQEQPRVRLPE
ncbi:MAG: hypothetical protein AB7O26_00815 [Planctomycetaceae bacterium]